MRITADTNVLLRSAVLDDEQQMRAAQKALAEAELVAVPVAALCEYAWVLSHRYKVSGADIAAGIRIILDSDNVVTDARAVEAGLAMLEAGGDFADGVIAHEGAELGAGVFVSFDKKAVRRLSGAGVDARLLK